MIRSAIAVLGSNMGIAVLKFLRNIALARMLTVSDYGTANTFAVIFALIEMIGYLGLDRLLVQDKNGDTPRMQAVLQAVQVVRGILLALLLFLTAQPLADLMGVPEVGWGFQVMAVMPLIQGFWHLDMARAERSYRFGPVIWVMLGSELGALLAIFPMYYLFGDYRMALWTLVFQQVLRCVISHATATRPYRLAWDWGIFRRAMSFGWPLFLAAMMLFIVFQGARVIIANQLGIEALGQFSVVFMLTMTASNVLMQSVQRLLLPRLSAVQDQEQAFIRLAHVTTELGMAMGVLVVLGFSLFGNDLVLLLFGTKYAEALDILVWLALVQGIRLAKTGVSVVALARGETKNMFLGNLPRVLMFPFVWYALDHGYGLVFVVVTAVIGELMGLALSLWILRSWLRVPLRKLTGPFLWWALALGALALDTWLLPPVPVVFGNFNWVQIPLVALVAASLLGMVSLRGWLLGRWQLQRGRRQSPA